MTTPPDRDFFDTPRDRAFRCVPTFFASDIRLDLVDKIEEALEKAYSEGRDKGIEESAECVQFHSGKGCACGGPCECQCHSSEWIETYEYLRKKIRSLKEEKENK